MKKFFKNVIQVLPDLDFKGRFFAITLDHEIYRGSKDTIFALVGSSVSAIQLLIPFALYF